MKKIFISVSFLICIIIAVVLHKYSIQHILIDNEKMAIEIADVLYRNKIEDTELRLNATEDSFFWYVSLDYDKIMKEDNINILDYEYEVVIRKSDGKIKSATINGVSLSEYKKAIQKDYES